MRSFKLLVQRFRFAFTKALVAKVVGEFRMDGKLTKFRQCGPAKTAREDGKNRGIMLTKEERLDTKQFVVGGLHKDDFE